jgi:hypothetical protein
MAKISRDKGQTKENIDEAGGMLSSFCYNPEDLMLCAHCLENQKSNSVNKCTEKNTATW